MKWPAATTAAVPGSGSFSCSPAAADAAETMASSAATADAETTAVCGSSCFCSAAAAMAASAETMADAAANQPSRKAGSMEPAFPSLCLYGKPCFPMIPHLLTSDPFPSFLFAAGTLRPSRKSSYHL